MSRAPRLLIAEDNEDVLSLLSQLEGFDLTIVRDGDECLAALEKGRFDAIILDVLLPKTSGLAVLREMKRNYPQTAIIIVTGYGDIIRPQVNEIGVDGFIEKPFTLDVVIEAVRAALASRGKSSATQP